METAKLARPAPDASTERQSARRRQPTDKLARKHAATVARACQRIEASPTPPSLEALAAECGVSRYHLHRIFKAITGLTPRAYAAAHRARRLRSSLGQSATITDAIYDAGFNTNSRFYENARQVLGMTASDYRSGGVGNEIRFAVAACSLGAILVAQSRIGVCAILMDDDPEKLVRQLQDLFPRADLVGGDATFERTVAQVIGFVEAPALGLALPLDIRGTAFQERVWKALRDIPAGATINYTELAERVGAPLAVRAVASACAANRLAVAIPCHRVVRRDGSLSGYRWGVERKRELLHRESQASS